jgi:hypothetical protein
VPISSQKSYIIDDKGKLTFVNDMNYGRQYFAMCGDYDNEYAYVIGGFNHEKGLMNSVEKFSFKARKWVTSESINSPRINAAACKCGQRYIYLFGGLDKKDFLDTIERFNLQLDIWTVMKVRMPCKISNLFSYSINNDYIVIMGGMRKKDEEFIPKESKKIYELENRVFAFKTSNQKWKDLKPFPFKKKLGSVIYNGFGKFFCNIIEDNKELPQLFVYDIRNAFPQFDKYWENEKNQREGIQKIKGKDIKVHIAYSLTSKQYPQRSLEGPVDIAEGRSGVFISSGAAEEH